MCIYFTILTLESFITVLSCYGASPSLFDVYWAHRVRQSKTLAMERKNNNCVVHVRQDSDNDLEALFHVISKNSVAKTHPEPASSQSLPMRLRKLPPSFFKQPPIDGSLSPDQDVPKRLPISHSHSRSSPASLTVPTTLKGPPNHSLSPGVHHQRSTSFDNTALLEEPTPMPPGWEMRTTASGQRYFMK